MRRRRGIRELMNTCSICAAPPPTDVLAVADGDAVLSQGVRTEVVLILAGMLMHSCQEARSCGRKRMIRLLLEDITLLRGDSTAPTVHPRAMRLAFVFEPANPILDRFSAGLPTAPPSGHVIP
jgi:hypothetical protein